MEPKLALNLRFSCLSLSRVGIIGLYHRVLETFKLGNPW